MVVGGEGIKNAHKNIYIYIHICTYVYLYENDYLYIPLIYIIYTIKHRKSNRAQIIKQMEYNHNRPIWAKSLQMFFVLFIFFFKLSMCFKCLKLFKKVKNESQ